MILFVTAVERAAARRRLVTLKLISLVWFGRSTYTIIKAQTERLTSPLIERPVSVRHVWVQKFSPDISRVTALMEGAGRGVGREMFSHRWPGPPPLHNVGKNNPCGDTEQLSTPLQ